MNKYRINITVIPEDDANRQLAIGFVKHYAVDARSIRIVPPAGGWSSVMETFKRNFVSRLERYARAYVVLLVDFDDKENRRSHLEKMIPASVKDRVFIIGSQGEPEGVNRNTGEDFEEIGRRLADECFREHYDLWDSSHFDHNAGERARLAAAVKSILFAG